MTWANNNGLLWVIVGRIFTAVLALSAIRIATTLLAPEQYGELALLLAVQTLCGLFLVNPVGQYINLHTHKWWDEGTLRQKLSAYKYYILGVSILGALIASLINRYSANNLIALSFTMSSMVIAATWNATYISFLNMLGFRTSSVFWSSTTVAFGLLASVLLVLWERSATAWFAGQVIGMAIGAIGSKWALCKRGLKSAQKSNDFSLFTKDIVYFYYIPLAIATGLMWIQLSGYRFAVEHYWGLAQLGFLAIGFQLASQVFALCESLIMQIIYPMFFKRVSDHNDSAEVQLAFSDLLNILMPAYFVLTGLVILNASNLLKILVASQYQEATFFVVLGACIELCRVLSNLVSNAAHLKRNTKALTIPYLLGAITSLCLISYVGNMGNNIELAMLGLFLGNAILLITMLIYMYKQLKFSLNGRVGITAIFIMIVMAASSFFLPASKTIYDSVVVLILTSILSAALLLILLWKSDALSRTLSVNLNGGSIDNK